jgi:cysteine-rich repeat protein
MPSYDSTRTLALLGAIAAIAAGCTDPVATPSVDAGTTTPDAGDGCVELTLGAQDFQANLFGQLTGVRYTVSPGLDDGLPESLILELYDSTTPGLSPLQPGTFALGTAPNDSLATCQHCLWLPVNWDGFSPLSTLFFATEGSITLTQVEDPLTPVFAGSTTDIVLREATVDETGAATLVSGGRCVRVPALTFDTSPTPGRACLSAEDCGNPLLEVCSPATGACAPIECSELLACPAQRPICLTQYGTMDAGACYYRCDPTKANSCGQGRVCVQFGVEPTSGYCLLTGDGALGGACAIEDTATTCGAGMTCSAADQTCTRTCQYFTSNPGCQAEHACTVLGVCDPVTSSAAAAFGQPCNATADMAQGCAAADGVFRGICVGFDPVQPLTCEKACYDNVGCDDGEFCALRFTSGLGICLPNPVCGDGVVGEINEVCDDGDEESGDGCSADCQTVEYDVLCSNAPVLATGETTGNTATAKDGFQATCQIGLARADLYRFTPPSRGRLRLTVDAPKTHAVSVRSDCADAASELACATSDAFGVDGVTYQITTDAELTVLVSASTVLEQGPYTLHTEFVAESCGDGIMAGLEACDDGNKSSNDGCSADCTTIEYAAYCAQAATLTASVTGDNTGGPTVFKGSCANSALGAGPVRLFKYTAPSAGTARFRLEPTDSSADLVLAVFDSCGTPASMNELGCSSVYDIEKVDAPVTAGQTLTILVAGFHPHSVSPFKLTAEMLP